MATNKLQWKRIAKGDKLPCQSFLRKKNGEILKLSTGAGVTVGQDAYYLPVDDVIEEIRNYPIEETKDERVIEYFKELAPFYNAEELYDKYGFSHKDAIAWLEKKCEQKLYVNDNAKEMFIKALERVEEQNNKGYKLTDCDKNSWWEDFKAYTSCIIEQKPVKVPKFKVGDFIQFNGMGHTRYTIKEVCGLSHYINTCNKRMDMSYTDANFELVEQKPTWSEEDEEMHRKCICAMRASACGFPEEEKFVEQVNNWLKSIKDRVQPQSQWKPSREQMVALNCAITAASDNFVCLNVKDLKSLYEDLKKLKE